MERESGMGHGGKVVRVRGGGDHGSSSQVGERENTISSYVKDRLGRAPDGSTDFFGLVYSHDHFIAGSEEEAWIRCLT